MFSLFFFQPKCPILRLVIRDGMIHDPICMKLVHCLASTSPYLVWYKSEISTIFGLSLPLFGANASPRAVIISLLPVIPGRYLALFLTDISRMDQNNQLKKVLFCRHHHIKRKYYKEYLFLNYSLLRSINLYLSSIMMEIKL